MSTFVLLSKLAPGSATEVKAILKSDKDFQAQFEKQCPGVKRLASYARLGAYDFVHIFEAAKVALLASPFWAVYTQAFTAIPFSQFQQIVEEL